MDNCCWEIYVSQLEVPPAARQYHSHTATSMRSRATSSMLRMTFFSILTSCDSLRDRSGPKAPAAFLRKAWPGRKRCQRLFQSSSISIGGRARCRVGPSRVAGGGMAARSGSIGKPQQQMGTARDSENHLSPSFSDHTHQFRPFLAIGWTWSRTMGAGGSRSARRSGRASGAWNRCDAWWDGSLDKGTGTQRLYLAHESMKGGLGKRKEFLAQE